MAFFSGTCPHCGRPLCIGVNGSCVTTFNDGTVCGFSLPIKYNDGNSTYKIKVKKHTTPAPPKPSSTVSWASSTGDYENNQETTLFSGSICLDPSNEYLFLWNTPSGANPIAQVMYASSGTVASASGVVLPLNSKIQNLHHRYSNWEQHFVHIADGPNLTIEAPNPNHSDYHVTQSGKLVCTFDPSSLNLTTY